MREFLKLNRKKEETFREKVSEEVQIPETVGPSEELPAEMPGKQEPAPTADLYSGMMAEVLTLENHLIFVGTLEVLGRDMIQIREETGQSVPAVEYNLRVKLRAFRRGDQVIALYGKVCGSCAEFWRVDRLEMVQTEEKREYFRQNIRVDAQIQEIMELPEIRVDAQVQKVPEAQELLEEQCQPRPCRVLDVSAGGVLFRCREEFQKGQLLRLSGVQLLPGEDAFSFTCRVQRIVPNDRYTHYGCQFERMTVNEADRLMRVILTLQRKALQARRGSGDLL